MAVTTEATEHTDSGWKEIATGAGEFNVTATVPLRWALKATPAPEASLHGHILADGDLALNIPAGISLWVRRADGQRGAYQVIVTPGQ